jgi:decaprenyl-phosphate phosphoribosyltransferase
MTTVPASPPSVGGAARRAPGRAMVRLLRPRQWVKNAFVLAPLIFSGSFTQPVAVRNAIIAVLLFCVAASAAYVFNDIIDAPADARHPVKSRTRPLAAGDVSMGQARSLFAVLLALVLAAFAWSPPTAIVAVAYVALNIAYSLRLKRIPVVDIFVLAAGFVLRVYAGAAAIDVPVSSWMLITTLSLALYLAVIKRRQELAGSGATTRSVLQFYTLPLLDRYAETAALSAIVFYGLFVVTIRPRLNVTMPFVLFGLFRYWYLVEANGQGETPTEVVWGDPTLILTVIAWAAVCVWRLMG